MTSAEAWFSIALRPQKPAGLIIIMYIYHALINALGAHMICINLNMLYTCRAQSNPNNPHKAPYGETDNPSHPNNPHKAPYGKTNNPSHPNNPHKAPYGKTNNTSPPHTHTHTQTHMKKRERKSLK